MVQWSVQAFMLHHHDVTILRLAFGVNRCYAVQTLSRSCDQMQPRSWTSETVMSENSVPEEEKSMMIIIKGQGLVRGNDVTPALVPGFNASTSSRRLR